MSCLLVDPIYLFIAAVFTLTDVNAREKIQLLSISSFIYKLRHFPQLHPVPLTLILNVYTLSLSNFSVHEGCEQGSPPRLWCSDGRLSRSCSSENQHTLSLVGGCVGGGGSDWPKKEAEENKENVRLDQCFSNTSGLPTDLDGWNESVISGGSKSLKKRLNKHLNICMMVCVFVLTPY